MKIISLFFCVLVMLAIATAISTSPNHRGVSAAPHKCAHDEMKNMPGYGLDSPVVEGVKYEFHDDEVFKAYYKSKTQHGATSKHPHLHDDRPSKLRVADVMTVNPSLTLNNMRFKAFFDFGTCPGANCGHCVSVGQTVQTFEGSSTVTCTQNDVLTPEKKTYVMDVLMPRAMEFLGNALRINPVVGNLVPSGGNCGSPGTPIPATHSTVGVPDADFLIYVTAAPKSDPNALTVAWALNCRRDGSNRPIVAHVNFVPKSLSNAVPLDPIEMASDLLTAKHEISHALGFSSPFFDGLGYYDDNYNFVSGGGIVTQASAAPFNKIRRFINSTRVVREVRALFNCPTAIGAEIEDQGGAGTAGSHWEKRIYPQHQMAGIGTTIASYPSRMLLAYFEDSGHYVANYSVLDDSKYYINYGRDKGCDFINQRCDYATNKALDEYCWTADSSIRVCTYDGLAIGYCSANAFSSALPSNMQYFSDPATGSSIQLDDFCPNAIFYSNQRCVATDTVSAVQGSGESFGSSSRCFQSDIVSDQAKSLFQSSASSAKPVSQQARCFETICNKDGSLSVVVDLRLVPCPADGSAGNADVSGLSGYTGTIICPAAIRFCPRIAGPNGTKIYKPLPMLTPDTRPAASRSWAGAFVEPIPAACAARRACATLAFDTYMPACRTAAFEIARCFGTDCDGDMATFIKQNLGLATNCSANRNGFALFCQEGKAGSNALCSLAGAGKLMTSVMLGVVVMISIVILI